MFNATCQREIERKLLQEFTLPHTDVGEFVPVCPRRGKESTRRERNLSEATRGLIHADSSTYRVNKTEHSMQILLPHSAEMDFE